MPKKYVVRLTTAEREELLSILRKGRCIAYRRRHAQILLKCDADGPGWSDEEVADAVECHRNTVAAVRQRFVEQGFEAALDRKKQYRLSRERRLDGRGEAVLLQLACSQPPDGRAAWTLQLLADELVRLQVTDAISHETVRQVLKKTRSSRT